MRMWCAENPHVFVETSLHPEKVGVWAAVSGRRIIVPILFEGNLNAVRYREEILQPFFEELHDDELEQEYFQQYGATPHCTQENLVALGEFFGNRIISQNTAIPWPLRSCDLSVCDSLYLPPQLLI